MQYNIYLQQLKPILELHGIAGQACPNMKLRLKLADFGLACSFTPGEVLSSKVGTVLYCSPQAARVGHCWNDESWLYPICIYFFQVNLCIVSVTWRNMTNYFFDKVFLPCSGAWQGSQWCLWQFSWSLELRCHHVRLGCLVTAFESPQQSTRAIGQPATGNHRAQMLLGCLLPFNGKNEAEAGF